MTTNNVQAFSLKEDERKEGKYSPETLARILGAMNQDGLVVLKDVIAVEQIEKLNAWMCEDAERRTRDPSQSYNHGIKNNILQRPPITEPEYLTKDVYFNPFVLQLANAYLGHRPVWNWLTANASLAGRPSQRQPVHKDSSSEHPLFPYYFIANIPLCEFNVANGSTEFWLGSHALTTHHDQKIAMTEDDIAPYPSAEVGNVIPAIKDDVKEQRRAFRPPIQPVCGPGDVMIRDIRLWHAGMPNGSDAHRIMLGLGYQSPYHPNYTIRLHLPFSQREFFLKHAAENVELRAQWYTDEDLAKTDEDTVFFIRANYL